MKDNTIVTHAGNRPFENQGIINPPVYHASTVLSPTMDALLNKGDAKVRYGRRGTPTTFALEDAMTELERAHGTVLAPSGKAAITMTLSALVEPGDHILMTDSAYAPTRSFADTFLKRFGIETEYYDPLIGAGIQNLCRDNTRLIWTESPGSQTFEVQDIPAITAAARNAGIITVMDNTWAGGYFFKPLDHGVDISVQAATKYIVGHSDVMMGTIACNEATFDKVKTGSDTFGICTGPDDVYLTLRGLRTIGARMPAHHRNALQVAEWLQQRPEVTRVMYPALPQDPGHAIWSRDFTGASGLFGFVINTAEQKKIAAFLDDLKLYGMGSSWGGYESLMLPSWPNKNRSATKWDAEGQTMRVHVGLEDVGDLIADLDAGFDRLNAA
ncbi:MAG: cystathionine beta-lyase [Rhodospirillaceae bacterium]|jgi:cysteine-S-conjugate beta-lyase|nr:cystathionine beta-lyase [Rhodospirillaceae bacterium]